MLDSVRGRRVGLFRAICRRGIGVFRARFASTLFGVLLGQGRHIAQPVDQLLQILGCDAGAALKRGLRHGQHVVQQGSQKPILLEGPALLLFQSVDLFLLLHEVLLDPFEKIQQARVALPPILRRSTEHCFGRSDTMLHVRHVNYISHLRLSPAATASLIPGGVPSPWPPSVSVMVRKPDLLKYKPRPVDKWNTL